MERLPRISVIIPTYNRPEDLKNCLISLEEQTMKPYEVIIIDDNSSISLSKEISQFKKNKKLNIRYYKNRINKRQSYSKNRGARLAKGEILTFLDDDCTPNKDFVQNIILEVYNNKTSFFGGRIYNLSSENFLIDEIIEATKHLFLLRGKRTGKILPTSQTTAKFEEKGRFYVDWVSAGNLSIKKRLFKKIGGFDIKNFKGHCSFEEPDFCVRIHQKYKIRPLYNGNLICYHKYSKTGRKNFGFKKFENFYYNQIIFFIKNDLHKKKSNLFWFIFYNLYQITTCLFLSIYSKKYFYIIKGKLKGLHTLIKC